MTIDTYELSRDELEEKLNAASHLMLDKLVNSGVLTEEQIQPFKEQYAFIVANSKSFPNIIKAWLFKEVSPQSSRILLIRLWEPEKKKEEKKVEEFS